MTYIEIDFSSDEAIYQQLCNQIIQGIAISRLAEGEVLTLDEPFQGLDEDSRKRAAETVGRHLRGRTVLLVTHDAGEAAALGGEIWQFPLDNAPRGRVESKGSMGE